MPEDVPLGTQLHRHRRAAGMTLEEAAETSGVSARAISDMERHVAMVSHPDAAADLIKKAASTMAS